MNIRIMKKLIKEHEIEPINFISDNEEYKIKEGIYKKIMRETKKNISTQKAIMRHLKIKLRRH